MIIRDINQFILQRPEQYASAIEINDNINKGQKTQQLFAFLKSGKRETMEAVSLLRFKTSVIYYITSLNRKDIDDQIQEFAKYNIKTLLVGKSGVIPAIPNYDSNTEYILFCDENDYGDNKNQKMEALYKAYGHSQNIFIVAMSSTPFSLMAVSLWYPNIAYVISKVDSSYCGIRKMLNKTIINRPFLYVWKHNALNFTTDFTRVLKSWLSQTKYTKLIVRDTHFSQKHLDKVKQLLRAEQKIMGFNRNANVTLVDKDNSFDWKKDNWEGFELIIVKQTFTRATETNIHPYCFGYYDPRTDKTALNTLLQCLGRFCCYTDNTHIRLFLSKEGFNYVDANNYMETALLNNVPINTIINNLHLNYGIEKLSGNTSLNSNLSNIGTWIYTPYLGKITSNHTLLDKNTVDKNRVAHALACGTEADGQWLGNDGFITIIDLQDVINNCLNPLDAKYLQQARVDYNIPLQGNFCLKGIRIAPPTKKTIINTKSSYLDLAKQGKL